MFQAPVFQAFVITLREGLEAFLIVAISLAYLRKSGRHQLIPAVHWGIGAAVVVSVAAAWLFQRASNQALWEGVLALTAAVLVASLIVHMWRHARTIKRDIEHRLSVSAAQVGIQAAAGVFLFTLLMITREGMETALLMGTLVSQGSGAMNLILGASLGVVAAASMAWLWSKYGHKVNLGLFFQVTAVFLAVFVVQLVIYGFHELTEANLFPGSETLHWATEPYGPDGIYGQYLSYMLVVLPMGWLIVSAIVGRKAPQTQPATR
jgi:high-affinity iron transporter